MNSHPPLFFSGSRRSAGFTLIEVMMVVAIIGILLAVALPSYKQYIVRGKRSGAQSQMLDIANREQQFLLANRIYATKTVLEQNGYILPSEISAAYTYSLTIGTGTVPSYTITFSPTGSQASDGDITLNSEGVKLPANKW